MNISNRLKTIADMIDSNYHVIDVGCDHALLDIYLTLNKKISSKLNNSFEKDFCILDYCLTYKYIHAILK